MSDFGPQAAKDITANALNKFQRKIILRMNRNGSAKKARVLTSYIWCERAVRAFPFFMDNIIKFLSKTFYISSLKLI